MSAPSRRAFTLIELMVVIVMIAVMAGTIVPAYNRFYAKSQFENSVRQVQDIFAWAREQAITRDTTVTVTYDAQRHAFTAQTAPGQPQSDLPVALASTINSDGTAAQPGESQRSAPVNPEINITTFSVGTNPNSSQTPNDATPSRSSGNQLHFLSDGTVESANLEMMNADGYGAAFQLWPATGRLVRTDPQP